MCIELPQEPFNSLGELCEMKTILEKYRNISNEMVKREAELAALESSTAELPPNCGGADADYSREIDALREELRAQKSVCDRMIAATEKEIEENNSYGASLQETEKWLLQMNFQVRVINLTFG